MYIYICIYTHKYIYIYIGNIPPFLLLFLDSFIFNAFDVVWLIAAQPIALSTSDVDDRWSTVDGRMSISRFVSYSFA